MAAHEIVKSANGALVVRDARGKKLGFLTRDKLRATTYGDPESLTEERIKNHFGVGLEDLRRMAEES